MAVEVDGGLGDEHAPESEGDSHRRRVTVNRGSIGAFLTRDRMGVMPLSRTVKARPHTPVYMMHKFWARRPHNVFSELIRHHSRPGDVVLDPFCGGGVTVVEALRLKRRVVGVDVNPLATYITEMEVRPLDVTRFWESYEEVRHDVEHELSGLYRTSCPKCNNRFAIFDWMEWEDKKPLRMKYRCPHCGVDTKEAKDEDIELSAQIDRSFDTVIRDGQLWYPRTEIPKGDKTDGMINRGYTHFWRLFTKRNLLALSILRKRILSVDDPDARDFLLFSLSGSLKWVSQQSHLRGEIVEGWAMHAYWIYPRTLEINVWNTFERRCRAVAKGKEYSNRQIGSFYRKAESVDDLLEGDSTSLVMTRSSADIPIPSESVDLVVTDPPYGGNVNYGELSDYWMVWNNDGITIDKAQEVIINRTRRKDLTDYEDGLRKVFEECFRILRKGGNMVVTFNSKDLRVVTSFVIATSRAGFALHPRGLLYQPPISAYTTTLHAMQLGAFTGDFVFTFFKPAQSSTDQLLTEAEIDELDHKMDSLIRNHLGERVTEPELREQVYRVLIPLLASHAKANLEACRELVGRLELKIRKLEPHFRELRRHLVEERRRKFLGRKRS